MGRLRDRVGAAIERRPGTFLTLVGVLGVIIIAGAAFIEGLGPNHAQPVRRVIALGLGTTGGALVAAVFVGLLVERLTQHRLARETGEEWLWAVLGEDTPEELKDKTKAVIAHGQAHLRVHFRCRMTWADDSADCNDLCLSIEVITDGVNFSRKESYAPSGRLWVMPSVPGWQSRYTGFVYEVFGSDSAEAPRRMEAEPEDLIAHTEEQPDHSILVNQEALIDIARKRRGYEPREICAETRDRFRIERDVELVLRAKDFFPVVIVVPTVDVSFELFGPACADLSIEARSGRHAVPINEEEGTHHLKQTALLPNEVVILSWQRKEPREDIAAAASGPADITVDPAGEATPETPDGAVATSS